MPRLPPRSTLFPYTTLFRSDPARAGRLHILEVQRLMRTSPKAVIAVVNGWAAGGGHSLHVVADLTLARSEEHTSELQSRGHLVCRLLLEKKKNITRSLDAVL